MADNGIQVGLLEDWVHGSMSLQTWRNVYSCKINLIPSRQFWEKSHIPTTLIPPYILPQVGRPCKKRKKSTVVVKRGTTKEVVLDQTMLLEVDHKHQGKGKHLQVKLQLDPNHQGKAKDLQVKRQVDPNHQGKAKDLQVDHGLQGRAKENKLQVTLHHLQVKGEPIKQQPR
ncbi:hypothetical protein Tco_1209319 [Tanacetum coccineum]